MSYIKFNSYIFYIPHPIIIGIVRKERMKERKKVTMMMMMKVKHP